MRKRVRSLSTSLVLTALLGACQAAPTSVAPFQTKQTPPSAVTETAPDATASKRSTPPRHSNPNRPSRPKKGPSNRGGDQRRPYRPNPYPSDRYVPVPVPVPVRDGDYPDGQLGDTRITRVWTEDVQSDRLTVNWTTDRAAVGLVEWGTADYTEQTDWQRPADTVHSVVIRDLEPDTEYRFRVVARTSGGASVSSPELRARTEP